MKPALQVKDASDLTRKQILQAAETRFIHYGYSKTTMVEIAEDCSMSAANLYRFFANKQEIITACAERCMEDRLNILAKIAGDERTSAVKTLENYVLATLTFSHDLATTNPKINELVENIKQRNPEIIYRRIETEIKLIEKILQKGLRKGEFEIKDINTTARAINTCLVVFEIPTFIHLYPFDEYREMARASVNLIVNGIRSGRKS